MKTVAFRIDTKHPSDTVELERLLDSGALRADQVLCILGKTEGNGGRNDFSRDAAMGAFERVFARRLGIAESEVHDRVVFSLSGGTEGVVTPHIIVFAKLDDGAPASRRAEKRMCVAIGYTREFLPQEIGTRAQVDETARAVRELVATMQLDAAHDVHLIQMKGAIPSASFAEAEAARESGRPLRNDMVHSRGASALGVAVALGEVTDAAVTDESICADFSLFSSVASCSAKPGLKRTELLAFGMSAFWDGDLVIDHIVLRDLLDLQRIGELMASLGLGAIGSVDARALVGVFAKSEADPRGTIRGHRHTMLSDDDISDTRYSRCVLSSVLAAALGDSRIYVSTRAEHHGPLGGGPLAIMATSSTKGNPS